MHKKHLWLITGSRMGDGGKLAFSVLFPSIMFAFLSHRMYYFYCIQNRSPLKQQRDTHLLDA